MPTTGTPFIGHGSKLQLGSGGGSETFTDIAVQDIQFGSNKVDTHDVTDMSSTGPRPFIGGLEDSGDCTVKMLFKPGDAGQTALHTAKDGAAHNFKAIYTAAVQTKSFSGIITSWDESVTDDKPATLTVKIKISGAITLS